MKTWPVFDMPTTCCGSRGCTATALIVASALTPRSKPFQLLPTSSLRKIPPSLLLKAGLAVAAAGTLSFCIAALVNYGLSSRFVFARSATAQGFALFFHNFSTFEGRPGIYLEDLFVRPEARGHGLGKALLANLAKRALAQGCARVEWSVLDWNTPSIDFYKSLGGVLMDEWTVVRVSGDALQRLAAK